jgi:hypothetical protein
MSEKKHLIRAIGGSTRVGKTESANEYHAQHPDVKIISADDDIRSVLWKNNHMRRFAKISEAAGQCTVERALFQELLDGRHWEDDEAWFPHVAKRKLDNGDSYFVWRHEAQHPAIWQLGDVEERLTYASKFREVLIEGACVRPEYMQSLVSKGHEVRAIFLGNENPEFTETMVKIVHEARDKNPASNWMANRDWSDDRIRYYMGMVREFSRRRRDEAEANGFPYMDMGEFGGEFRERAIPRVVGYLATGDVEILQS